MHRFFWVYCTCALAADRWGWWVALAGVLVLEVAGFFLTGLLDAWRSDPSRPLAWLGWLEPRQERDDHPPERWHVNYRSALADWRRRGGYQPKPGDGGEVKPPPKSP